MASLTVSPTDANGAIPINLLEFSLRTSQQAAHVWVASNVFGNLPQGTYYGAVRRRSTGRIIGQSVLNILSSTNLPYEATFDDGGEIWITQAQHGKSKIANVLIIDLATGYSLTNNYRLYPNSQPPYAESVTINVEVGQKILVRIY